MEIPLLTSEMEVLRKLKRNLAGSSGYTRVTCILMLGMGNSHYFVASCLGIDVFTVYRYIISDNARYYHNKKLKEWVERTKNRQIFLSLYLPNLNLIERLWKFLRNKVINTSFYRTKEKFRQAVKDFFDNIEKYKEELEAFLILKFRLCNSQTISF